MGNRRGACRVWVRRPDRKRPHRKHRRRWKVHIKIDIQEVEWVNGLHCSDSEQGQTGGGGELVMR
jgi:hypothetical protein